MPVNRSQRRHVRKHTTVTLDKDTADQQAFDVWFYPGKMTPEMISKIQEATTDIRQVARGISQFVASWDIVDVQVELVLDEEGNGQIDPDTGELMTRPVLDEQGQQVMYNVPPTYEEAMRMDLSVLNAVVRACVAAQQPGETNAGSFAAS